MNSNPSPENSAVAKVKRINPWIGIWRHPRETLVFVWQHMLEDYIHRIYMLTGLMFMLAARLPDWYALAPHPIGVMIQLLLFAPIGGIMAGYIFAAVLRRVGKWMGKVVPSPHAKAMVAWSDLPFAAFAAVFVIVFLVLDRSQGPLHKGQIWLFQDVVGWLPLLIASPLYLWGVITRMRSIMVMFGLSAPKAMLTWAVTTFLAYVPVSGMITVFMILYYVTTSGGN